jgi:hypothetical protein
MKDNQEAEKLANDPIYKLEHSQADEKRAKEAAPSITLLQDYNDARWSDPFLMSQKMRKRFRVCMHHLFIPCFYICIRLIVTHVISNTYHTGKKICIGGKKDS